MVDEAKKILIVEDDEAFRSILEKTFERTEFATVSAEDGETGMQKAKDEHPDLILLDIQLPGIDGIELAKKLKEAGLNIPIIFLTNLKDEKRISDAMMISGGDTEYIVKTDIRVEDIADRVRKRLKLI
jgi:DNA-binding response OmpR family regulator